MKALVRSYWLPKHGNAIREYEDAYWPQSQGEVQGRTLRYAVADGATESIFSRLWARMLVSLYCSALTPLPTVNSMQFQERVECAGRRWAKQVTSRPLPWHAWDKLGRGSFASLLGLCLCERQNQKASQSGGWEAFAVGDTCLFQLRDAELIAQYPAMTADQFGYHPLALSTDASKNQTAWGIADQSGHKGTWKCGDYFLLMTDALAQWFVTQTESGSRPFPILHQAVESSDAFTEWVQEQRSDRQIKNDDVTLMLIRV